MARGAPVLRRGRSAGFRRACRVATPVPSQPGMVGLGLGALDLGPSTRGFAASRLGGAEGWRAGGLEG